MANRICSHCKTENSETANYCRKCGFVLPGGSTEVSSDKTLISKIKDLQDKITQVETESKSKDNDLINLASEKSALRQNVSKLQTENGNLRSSLSSANKRADTAEQEAKKAKFDLSESESGKTTIHVLYIILIVVASIFGIVQCNNNQNKEYEISSLNSDKSQLSEQVNSLKSENTKLTNSNNSLSSILEKLGSKNPLYLGDVYIKNSGESYGSTIYSRNTTYITPKLEIFSLIEGNVDILVKFYTPYGLSTGTGDWAPPAPGFSYKSSVYLQKNQNCTVELSGWGGTDKGHWSSGAYRFEFYYKGKCLGTKSYTIY